MLNLNKTKQEIIIDISKSKKNPGSSSVQIALLTKEIKYLTNHILKNKKDFVAKTSLLKKVSQRKKLLKYLKKTKLDVYKKILSDLKLRK